MLGRPHGVPANQAGWIVPTARNRATDVVRRDERGRQLYRQVAPTQASSDSTQTPQQHDLVDPLRGRLL
jgi:RNA polymerase sigma-70 factor (ECF subfamily)